MQATLIEDYAKGVAQLLEQIEEYRAIIGKLMAGDFAIPAEAYAHLDVETVAGGRALAIDLINYALNRETRVADEGILKDIFPDPSRFSTKMLFFAAYHLAIIAIKVRNFDTNPRAAIVQAIDNADEFVWDIPEITNQP